MMLRLIVSTPKGDCSTFEHAGPTVRIGRETTCELRLRDAASANVSREHARIDLEGGGAVLADLGSSNGTLLNEERVAAPRPLHVGDRIRLGYTGACLTVVGLDLAPAAVPTPHALPRRIGRPTPSARARLGLALAGAAVVAIVLVFACRVLVQDTCTDTPSIPVTGSEGDARRPGEMDDPAPHVFSLKISPEQLRSSPFRPR